MMFGSRSSPSSSGTSTPLSVALKQIRNGWIASLASTLIGVAALFFVASRPESTVGFLDFSLALVLLGLTYGIYRKSRICASLTLAIFVADKALQYYVNGRLSGGAVALIALFYFLAYAVVGTFAYHRLSKTSQGSTAQASEA